MSDVAASANKAPVGYACDCAVRIATDAAIPARNQPSRDGVLRAQGILTGLLSKARWWNR